MAVPVIDSAVEVFRLMPPNTPFTSSELLEAAKEHESKTFTTFGSLNRLDTVEGRTRNVPILLTSTRKHKVTEGSLTRIWHTEWKYTIRKMGRKWLADGYVQPVWGTK